jgi:hypothetical protein
MSVATPEAFFGHAIQTMPRVVELRREAVERLRERGLRRHEREREVERAQALQSLRRR